MFELLFWFYIVPATIVFVELLVQDEDATGDEVFDAFCPVKNIKTAFYILKEPLKGYSLKIANMINKSKDSND